jgi:hypothetical protein
MEFRIVDTVRLGGGKIVAWFLNGTDSCHPDEGGARFLRNVGSYKSHTA